MSLIKEKTIGISYLMSVYHIGIVFAHDEENPKDYSNYGTSFRIEYSHKSNSVHVRAMTNNGEDSFGKYVNEHPELVNGTVELPRFFAKNRVTNYAFDGIEQAYAKWILSKADKS